jgi:C1A family cysteine protease
MRQRNYGWKPDTFDARDMTYQYPFTISALPPVVDLRNLFTAIPVEDQGNIGSCTANALCGIFEHLHYIARGGHTDFSRLFLYYLERHREGTTNEDAGAMIRTGIKVLASHGCCAETLWPYRVGNVFVPPTQQALQAADKNKALAYRRVRGLNALKVALHTGNPVAFGFQIYSSAEAPNVSVTGKIPVPVRRGWFTREKLRGGHAVLAVGYNDDLGHVVFRNSWGSGWGELGYGYLPYEFVDDPDLSGDFWLISKAFFETA